MSKGIKKPTWQELLNDLYAIIEIPERLDQITDIVRLKELEIAINDILLSIIRSANTVDLSGQKPNYWRTNIGKYSLNYEQWEQMLNMIVERQTTLNLKVINEFIEERKKKQNAKKNNYSSLFFDRLESEQFFEYMVENWIKKTDSKVVALRCVFRKMWYKNTEEQTSYKIICSQSTFVRDYWNKKYKNIKELNPKRPKLNEYFSNSLFEVFDYHLNIYLSKKNTLSN